MTVFLAVIVLLLVASIVSRKRKPRHLFVWPISELHEHRSREVIERLTGMKGPR